MKNDSRPRVRALLAVLLSLAAGVGVADRAAADDDKRKPPPERASNMSPLTPAEIDDNLAIGGDDIASRTVRTRMTVAVQVNGTGPYKFVVDSGADTSVVGERIARKLQLPLGRPVLLHGMTESARVNRVLVDELALGPSTIHGLELPVLQERDLGGEGMIGIDALVEQRLMLDFEQQIIKVEDARTPPPRMDGDIVVIARLRRGQLILTQVKANGRSIEAVIDTGSMITIGNLALRDRLLRRNPAKLEKVEIVGVTGAKVDIQLARIAELKLGSIVLRNVMIAFADVPPFAVFGLDQEPSLLLGTDILEVFRRVSLDFRARKVRFQLKRCQSTAVAIGERYSRSLTRVSSSGVETCRR